MRAQHDKAGPYLRLCILVLYPLLHLVFRRRWHNLSGIPRTGPAIIAANHISHVDPLVVGLAVWKAGRRPQYLAKDSLFRIPLIGRVFYGTGQIPVRRGTADAATSLQAAVQALERGELVIIYPEGTVTRDPQRWPMRAKTGIARLALLQPDVPVIPIGQWGTAEFLDVYQRQFHPWPRKLVQVKVGPPVDLSEFRQSAPGESGTAEASAARAEPPTALLHQVADRIMLDVRRQVGELRGETPPEEFFRLSGEPHPHTAER